MVYGDRSRRPQKECLLCSDLRCGVRQGSRDCAIRIPRTDSKGRLSCVALCECDHRTERGGEHQTLPNAWRIRKTI
jgi:hypothetical protein